MTIRVLVTGAGGAAAISFMQTLTGDDIEFFAGDMDTYAAGLYLVPESRRVLIPRADAANFVDALLSLCVAHNVNILVPTVDAELMPLARAKGLFERAGIAVAVAKEQTLRICLDKALLMAHCADVIPVPRSAILDERFDAKDWSFPVIVKPRVGAGGRGFEVVPTAADLERHGRDGSLLVQEHLPGEEYSVDVFARRDGAVIAAVPRVRLKVDSGVAVAARTVHDEALERYAGLVANCIGLTGVANVQFKRDVNGVPKLLEVNARLPGTMPLTVQSGVHMPRLLVNAARGHEEPSAHIAFREIAMVRTWHEHYIAPNEFVRQAAPSTRDVEPAPRRERPSKLPASPALSRVSTAPSAPLM